MNEGNQDPGAAAAGNQDPAITAAGTATGAAAAAGAGAGDPLLINAAILGDFKDHPVFKTYEGKPVGEVFKSFVNAQSLIGGEKLVIPAGKLDTPENWDHVFDKLGRPKDANGYVFEKPTNLPEGLPYDEKLEGKFKAACHSLGILPKAAAGIYALWNEHQGEVFKAYEASQSEIAERTETALIKKLGTKAKYDEYVAGAHAALARYGGDPETIKAFVDKYGNDAFIVEVFGNVAKGMMEDAALRGDKTFDLMGEDAPALAKDIMSNPENKLYKAYHEKNHPQHDYAVAEVTRLHQAIHGNVKIAEG